MEQTKADKRQLKDIIQRGILRRCEEWLKTFLTLNPVDTKDNWIQRKTKNTKALFGFRK